MSNKTKITNYVKKELKKGFTLDQIQRVLINSGYNEKLVAKVIYNLKSKHEYNFDFLDFIKKIGWLDIVLFLVCYLFTGYLFDELGGFVLFLLYWLRFHLL